MINRISFFGYLFDKPVEHIIRYEILFKRDDRFLLKHTCIDANFENPSAEVSVSLCESFKECISIVVKNFRDLEVKNGVYRELEMEAELSKTYDALIHELSEACQVNGVISFSLFGHLCKYWPRSPASSFLASMGYLIPTTKKPHVYVLDDFIKVEISQKKLAANTSAVK
jgi:hypothetical protein